MGWPLLSQLASLRPAARKTLFLFILGLSEMNHAKPDAAQISFHEATLTGIVRQDSVVTLSLEGVFVAGDHRDAEVMVEGVDAVLRDGVPIAGLHMEKEDGEILTLREEGGQVLLIIEWNDFAAKSQEMAVYTLNGPNISLKVTRIAE